MAVKEIGHRKKLHALAGSNRASNSTLKNTLICERSPENRWFQIYPVEIIGVFGRGSEKASVFIGLIFQTVELPLLC